MSFNGADVSRSIQSLKRNPATSDGWIYGVPSDPLKNAQFREAARQRLVCVEAGECDPSSAEMRAFDRLLTQVPEHTWGVAQGWFLPDYANYVSGFGH